MDDMSFTRAHLWAVHLVKDFITSRSDKKLAVVPSHNWSICSPPKSISMYISPTPRLSQEEPLSVYKALPKPSITLHIIVNQGTTSHNIDVCLRETTILLITIFHCWLYFDFHPNIPLKCWIFSDWHEAWASQRVKTNRLVSKFYAWY